MCTPWFALLFSMELRLGDLFSSFNTNLIITLKMYLGQKQETNKKSVKMSLSLAKSHMSNVWTWPGHVGLCWSKSPRGLSDGSLHPRAGPWGWSGGDADPPDIICLTFGSISPPSREKIEFGPSFRRSEGGELCRLLHREQDLQQQPFLLVLSGSGKPATGTSQDTRTQEQTMPLQAANVSLQPTWGIFGSSFGFFFFFSKNKCQGLCVVFLFMGRKQMFAGRSNF